MPWIVPLGISGWGFQGRLRRLEPAQAFRFNNRGMSDDLRFQLAMRHVVGRRLTYAELTGKTEEGPTKELF